MARKFLSLAVAAFALYHGLAVLLVSIPREVTWQSAAQGLLPGMRAYLFATSQWQEWNLFSPNPLRRVTQYRIERQQNGTWMLVKRLCAESLPPCRRADELKLLGRIADDSTLTAVRKRYLQDVCRSQGLAAGTNVRLILEEYELPRGPLSLAEWKAFAPAFQLRPDVSTVCPG
jgi:hypothetical protein